MSRPTALGSRASNKEARILAAALRLFAERGLDGTSMRDVAEAVGVTKPTLYHYFPSKNALFAAIFRRAHFDEVRLVDLLHGSAPLRERLLEVGLDYLAAMRRPPHLALILVRHSLGPATDGPSRHAKALFTEHVERRIDRVGEALEAEAERRRIRVDARRLASHWVHALTHYWVFEVFVAGRAPAVSEARAHLEHLIDLCLTPFGPPRRTVRSIRPGPSVVPPS